MNDRATGRQRPAAPNGPGTGPAPLSKTEKRAAAKAAKKRAVTAAKRRQMLTVAGAAAAVIAVIAVVVVLALRSGDPATVGSAGDAASSSAAASGGASASASPVPFPPVPAGADPALSTKPAANAGSGSVSKLAVTTLIEGSGAAAQAGQTITVNYVGVTFADGKEFDSSWSRSQPISFALGAGKVIPGWDQGLVGVKVGSRVQLDIPASLAYGDNPGNGAPSGALRFVVDVLSVA